MELQADCYAGVWAAHASEASGGQVALEEGDIEEGLNAASRIGDDALSGGRASPETFTHGTSAQRVEWLRRGYQTGDPDQCDTFSAMNGGGGSSPGK
jgi:predicted metalloprotease